MGMTMTQKILARHAGLDSVSFGPDIQEVHTPREKMSVASVQRTWEFLLKILERL